jgi:signal transduction histidine kinase
MAAADSVRAARIIAVERAAEALDAEVAAIVRDGAVLSAVGYPEGAAPVAELESVLPGGRDGELHVPGVGVCPAAAAPLEHPPGAALVVARSQQPLGPDEAALLRGMANVASMRLGILRVLADERAARRELAASRMRLVATADETRRRIERDLHDGTQQKLITLVLELRALRDCMPMTQPDIAAKFARVEDGLSEVLDEVREIARGVHPAILSKGGIAPAVKALARRSSLPVELEVDAVDRLPQQVEVAAYYVVSEALANASKHARASVVRVHLEARDGTLRVVVRDNGIGGADPTKGSGIVGLIDRAEALGGRLTVASHQGSGTSIVAELPSREHPSGTALRDPAAQAYRRSSLSRARDAR